MSIKRTTHTWLKPLYDNLDGVNRYPLGSSTGVHGFYGQTGIAQIATGGLFVTTSSALGASGFQATGLGASGLYVHLSRASFNGGSGAAYTMTDIVAQLKNAGILIR